MIGDRLSEIISSDGIESHCVHEESWFGHLIESDCIPATDRDAAGA